MRLHRVFPLTILGISALLFAAALLFALRPVPPAASRVPGSALAALPAATPTAEGGIPGTATAPPPTATATPDFATPTEMPQPPHTATAVALPMESTVVPVPTATSAPPATVTTTRSPVAPANASLSPPALPPTPPPPPTATSRPPVPAATPQPTPAASPPVAVAPPASGVGVPVRLRIPSIGVDALVEQVATDAEGNMATPTDPWNTAWYAPGNRPGQPGNAAIAGHVDYRGIGPVVFWDLRTLPTGSEVLVETDSGLTLRFTVRDSAYYRPEAAPLARIFGPSTEANLNLITCGGTFDPATRQYDRRLVIFTTFAGVR